MIRTSCTLLLLLPLWTLIWSHANAEGESNITVGLVDDFAGAVVTATAPLPRTAIATSEDQPVKAPYTDGRPGATLRIDARDQGVVLRYGDGPEDCDKLGAREAIVFQSGGKYYLHYDGAGPRGWRACLAESDDLVHWTKKGPILDFGAPGEPDSACAVRRGCTSTAACGICSMSPHRWPRRRPISFRPCPT